MKIEHETRKPRESATDLLHDSQREQNRDVRTLLRPYFPKLKEEMHQTCLTGKYLEAAQMHENLHALFPEQDTAFTDDDKERIIQKLISDVSSSIGRLFQPDKPLDRVNAQLMHLALINTLEAGRVELSVDESKREEIRNDALSVIQFAFQEETIVTDQTGVSLNVVLRSLYRFFMLYPDQRSQLLPPDAWRQVIKGIESLTKHETAHLASVTLAVPLFPEYRSIFQSPDTREVITDIITTQIDRKNWQSASYWGMRLGLYTAMQVDFLPTGIVLHLEHTQKPAQPLPPRSVV